MERLNSVTNVLVRTAAQEQKINFPILIGGVAEQFSGSPETLLGTAVGLALCSALESTRRFLNTINTPIEVQPMKAKTLDQILTEIGMARVGGIKPNKS